MTATSDSQVILPEKGIVGQLQVDVEEAIRNAVHPDRGEVRLEEVLHQCYHVILGEVFDAAVLARQTWNKHLAVFTPRADTPVLNELAESISRMHRRRIHDFVFPWTAHVMALLKVLMDENYIIITPGDSFTIAAGENYPYWAKY